MAALQACCKEWDGIEAWGGVAQREWEEKKTSKPIIHYCGFLQLKMQISHALDQEASEDGRE